MKGSSTASPFKRRWSRMGREATGLRWIGRCATRLGARKWEVVTLEIVPVEAGEEPEPMVPPDVRKGLAAAPEDARELWLDITPMARRDWIQWITSGKRVETRVKRIATACDMLAKGKRRVCCFDRSGIYGKSISAPCPEPHSARG